LEERREVQEQVLGAVRESRIAYTGFDRTVEKVVVLDDDCVVTMGAEVVVPKGDRPDAGQRVARRYSHVWKKTSGSWRLVARHANVAPPSPPPR
jgi:ketosteroid isomerase-like protein